jgi:hypothetical protein
MKFSVYARMIHVMHPGVSYAKVGFGGGSSLE